MKKVYLLILLVVSAVLSVKAQNCLSHEYYLEQMARDPQFRLAQAKLEAETRLRMENKSIAADTTTLVIPIVFHIIHTGGSDNISEAQIRNQIDILNVEFKRKQADTSLTPSPFRALGGPFRVEFRLATLDPDGNCTNGITRHYSPVATCAEVAQDVKSLVYWPSNRYLNVWLVASMRYAGQTSCSGGGYAQFPGGAANTDGIEIRGDLIGSIGTAATNGGWGNFRGRYLIHELGHWFNLRHIWGDATCGNDLISDTPPAIQSNSGCPSFPHNANSSCGAGPNGEMTSNYMDYSQGACLNIFTKQQVVRMDAAITGSASGRNNLWNPANLALTGTTTITIPNCLAVPEMKPYGTRLICRTGVVSFIDASYGGTATGRRWSFPGGTTNGASSDSILNVTYSSPGVYSVSLTRKRGVDSATVTYAEKVVVLADTSDSQHVAPVADGFDGTGMGQWIGLNPDGDAGFAYFPTTGYIQPGCLKLSNSTNGPARIDELISPAFNLTGLTGGSLKFRVSFAKKSGTNRDKLEVYISNNCGQSWTKRSTKIANDATNPLQTISSNVTTSFTPSITSTQWREETIALSSGFMINDFRFKLTFTGSGGNNLYLDDFQITGTPILGNGQLLDGNPDVQLYPNPVDHGTLTVRLPSSIQNEVEFSLLDVCGKVSMQRSLSAGEQYNETQVSLAGIKPGIYFCSLKHKGIQLTVKKVVVE